MLIIPTSHQCDNSKLSTSAASEYLALTATQSSLLKPFHCLPCIDSYLILKQQQSFGINHVTSVQRVNYLFSTVTPEKKKKRIK